MNNNTECKGIQGALHHIADQAKKYHDKADNAEEKAFLLGMYHLAIHLEQGIKDAVNKKKGRLTINFNYKAAKTAYEMATQDCETLKHILEMLMEMESKKQKH